LVTNGQEGELIEGYEVGKAAIYLGIPPQEALTMPVFWVDWAFKVSEAEKNAAEKKEKAAKHRR